MYVIYLYTCTLVLLLFRPLNYYRELFLRSRYVVLSLHYSFVRRQPRELLESHPHIRYLRHRVQTDILEIKDRRKLSSERQTITSDL